MAIPSIDVQLDLIYKALHDQSERLDKISQFKNGFEGWVKFEVANAFAQGKRSPANDVGVEYRYKRPEEHEEPERKLIDLWIGKDKTYYFEFKNVFFNNNRGKQLLSLYGDFARLESVLDGDKTVLGYASVLIAVDFPKDAWSKALGELGQRFETSALRHDWKPLVDEGSHSVRFCALRSPISQQNRRVA